MSDRSPRCMDLVWQPSPTFETQSGRGKRPTNRRSAVVAVHQAAEAAEKGSFFAASPRHAGNGSDDAVREAAEWERLQPDAARALQRREEQSFAAEERRFDFSDVLDLVVHRRLKADDAAGVHPNHFAGREGPFVQRAAGVHERPTVALKPLHDEPLAAEESDAQAPLEGDADADPLGGGEKGIFLRDQLAADFGQVDGDDLPGIRRAERDLLL